jgi:hypothetical protein
VLMLGLLSLGLSAVAQKNGSIKGLAVDTLAKQPVSSATISVLDKKDSSLVTFTMTDNTGRFELKGIPNGEYRLLISHVNYHSSNTFFVINDEKKNQDLGNIAMSDITKVLGEVVVTNEAPPVTLIGDTVQYNAGSFKTQPNASVEQLLKKLPGVKVDKDGTVTAQGEKVSRVLVDGKEFFGNDPKVATKNLPADAIDKVQVYDKQSEQAQLTGFEDGNYEKTINLKLKKDKKKGVFGKITGGAGDKERYEGKFNVNSFKGARQLSAIGMANNTNAEGFSFMDILNFSGALSQMRQAGGGGNINISLTQDEANSLGAGNISNGGINTAWGGGVNYNNIIGSKLDLQSNYFYNRYNPYTQSHTLRQSIVQGGGNFYEENEISDNTNSTHRLNLNLLYQIDSLHSIRVIPSLSMQSGSTNSRRDYTTLSQDGKLVNQGFNENQSDRDGYNFKNDIIFRKKFNRKGRTLSLSLQNSFNSSEGSGSLESIIGYYNAGTFLRNDTMNQRNNTNSDLNGYSARLVYTEPMGRRSLLELSAGKSNTKSTSDKTTYDYNKASAKYDRLNEALSNDFENIYGYNNVGIRFRTQFRQFSYAFGVSWQQANLEGKIISGTKDSIIRKDFRNFLPNAIFKYNFSRFKTLSINYSTNTNQPSLSQLQPVPDLSNPLNISVGNPDLKQEYSHAFRVSLNLLSPFKNKNFFFFMTMMATQDKIVNYDSLDLATGIRRTKPVNVDGVYNINGRTSYSMPVRFLKGTVELSSSVRYSKGKQFINSIGNNIGTLTMGPEIRFDLNPNDKLNLGLGANYNYNRAKYSLESRLNNTYFTQEYNASVDWQLPKSFFLSTEFTYTVNTRRAEGFNINIPMLIASISKQFLKFNRGEIKLSARDLLNRNVAISRTSNQNYIEDKEMNSLRRFFLLSFTYSLSKAGLNNAGGPGGFRVMSR